MRKPAFCICKKNKDADQLRGNREADQRICFRFTDSTITLLSKAEISSLKVSSVAVQPGLCQTWSESRRPVFSNEVHIMVLAKQYVFQLFSSIFASSSLGKTCTCTNITYIL